MVRVRGLRTLQLWLKKNIFQKGLPNPEGYGYNTKGRKATRGRAVW